MPAFWSSKPKAPPINTAPTSNPTDDPSARAFSTTTQGTRSSEEGDNPVPSGQTTPKPSGLDNRIPAIASVCSAFSLNMLTDLVIGFPEFNTSSDYLVGDGDTDGGASAEYSHHTRRSHRSAKGKNDRQSFTGEESQTQST